MVVAVFTATGRFGVEIKKLSLELIVLIAFDMLYFNFLLFLSKQMNFSFSESEIRL